MTFGLPRHPESREADSPCGGCARVDRRRFISAASLLSVGALMTACGDGIFDGPGAFRDAVETPIRIDPRDFPSLQTIGGRATITSSEHAPLVLEWLGARNYRAFSLVCPHKGTTVGLSDDGFTCPNHGAQFARNGVWIGGQATVDLVAINVAAQSDGTLLVGGLVLPPLPPTLALSQSTITFSATVNGTTPAAQIVEITNAGEGTLNGMSIALTYGSNQPSGWLAASLSTLSAPSSLTLSVARGSLSAGTYTATVRVSAAGASNEAQTVTVSLIVIDTSTPAALQLSVPSVALSGTVGATVPSKSVQIVNSGAGTIGAVNIAIAYGAGASGWLSTSTLSGNSTPSTLTVRAQSTGLSGGTYTATVTVSGAGVPSKTLTVTLTLVNAGLAVTIAAWPALANVGGVAGSVGILNFSSVAVVRTGANSFAAFSLTCPHAGTNVQVVNGQSFRCPNHGAIWNASGQLLPNSPQSTSSLVALKVAYTPGDTVFYVT